MARLENLKAELTDIDWMDRFYWQTKNPEQHEKLGYLARQVRRRDLIAELLKMQQVVKRESAPNSSKSKTLSQQPSPKNCSPPK
ncbi:MAG TPA: hypothetical protein VK788_24995 [Terriglobales bacterium]|nr:hypothetical protein [Terriglobales bacterium]